MSIIRAPRPESNFYVLNKAISEDARLGWAARGLLIYLLGKPDRWRVSVEHLRKQTERARIRTGRDGIYALMKELEATGYLRVVQRRSADGKGFGAVDYEVSESVLPDQPEAGGDVLPAHADTPDADTPKPTLTSTETAARIEGVARTEDLRENSPRACARESISTAIAGVLCKHGFPVMAGDPRIQQAVAAGVSVDHVAEVAEVFGPNTAFASSPGYVLTIAQNQVTAVRGAEPVR